MTECPSLDIWVVRNNVSESAQIVAAIDDRALEQYRRDWRPLLQGEEDASWDWRDFVEREHRDGCVHFSLWVGDCCEGLAIVARHKAMRSEDAFTLHGCYVERLCTAPWNRQNVRNRTINSGRSRVKPVGKWLLWRAACLSLELGHSGRMGWHSLQGAKNDYLRVFPNLFDLGPDEDEDGLPWYEIDKSSARALIFDKQLTHGMNMPMFLNLPPSNGEFDD